METRRRWSSRRLSMTVRGHSMRHGDYVKLTICAEPVDQYLRTFQWNKVKYRADKPIADLIQSLQKVKTLYIPHVTLLIPFYRKSKASTTTSSPNSRNTTKQNPPSKPPSASAPAPSPQSPSSTSSPQSHSFRTPNISTPISSPCRTWS